MGITQVEGSTKEGRVHLSVLRCTTTPPGNTISLSLV